MENTYEGMENRGKAEAKQKETIKEILDTNSKALQSIKELLYTYSVTVDQVCGLEEQSSEKKDNSDIREMISVDSLIDVVKYQKGSLRDIERTLNRLNTRLMQTLG